MEPATDSEAGTDRTIVVGLVADPGLCAKIAHQLITELPEALSEHVSDQVSWHVSVTGDAVPVDSAGEIPLVPCAREMRPQYGWDLVFCLSDLPQRVRTRPLIGCYSSAHGGAQLSLPANGALRQRQNVRDTIVRLVDELWGDSLNPNDMPRVPHRLSRRSADLLAPARYVPSTQEGIDACLALVGARGKARLLAGMVRTNRPWRLVGGLSRATATAAAGGAFGIFFSNVWSLSDAMSLMRLALINVFVVAAMVAWLVAYNGLWERPTGRAARERAVLYNAATVLTLILGVACMYVVLFAVLLLGAVAVISGDYLQGTLGHPVSLADYARIVWLSGSMGTLAGALGAGLESETAVRRAIYSRREQERQARRRSEEEQGSPGSARSPSQRSGGELRNEPAD